MSVHEDAVEAYLGRRPSSMRATPANVIYFTFEF
jgi:hypothetical protein